MAIRFIYIVGNQRLLSERPTKIVRFIIHWFFPIVETALSFVFNKAECVRCF